MDEVTEIQPTKPKRKIRRRMRWNRSKVNVLIEDLPVAIHNDIKKYTLRIAAARGKRTNLTIGYIEALREFTSTLTFESDAAPGHQ
jgi:hypothetical protein